MRSASAGVIPCPSHGPITPSGESSGDEGRELVAITEGEVNFLWSFIQGSLVNPETWNSLLGSYGFCERHAWIHMSIEMAFRDEYLLGPTNIFMAR